jgi:hypothetical protein
MKNCQEGSKCSDTESCKLSSQKQLAKLQNQLKMANRMVEGGYSRTGLLVDLQRKIAQIEVEILRLNK